MKELIEIAHALKEHNDCALATVVGVEGSAYRRPGARMLLTGDGRSWGMVSGGCLEHDVVEHARQAMQTGKARSVRYDSTSDSDIVFGTGLGCNGVVDVLIEPVTRSLSDSFQGAVECCRTTRLPGAMATLLMDDGNSSRCEHAFLTREGTWSGDSNLTTLLHTEQVRPKTTFSLMNTASGRIFIQPLAAPVHLVVFGGWLDVVPLVSMAKTVGFQTTVVNAQPSLLPLLQEADSVLTCSPGEALSRIYFDERTATISMNHHFERDQETIGALTKANSFYIGMLGPKRRQDKILAGLEANGVAISEAFRKKLYGPAGLDLGANTPEEIALSILAEILSVMNERTAESIRSRLTPDGSISPNLHRKSLASSHA